MVCHHQTTHSFFKRTSTRVEVEELKPVSSAELEELKRASSAEREELDRLKSRVHSLELLAEPVGGSHTQLPVEARDGEVAAPVPAAQLSKVARLIVEPCGVLPDGATIDADAGGSLSNLVASIERQLGLEDLVFEVFDVDFSEWCCPSEVQDCVHSEDVQMRITSAKK